MRVSIKHIVWFVLAACVFAGCQNDEMVRDYPAPFNGHSYDPKDEVLVDLAFSLPTSSYRTRMASDVVQLNDLTGPYRDIDLNNFRLVATSYGTIMKSSVTDPSIHKVDKSLRYYHYNFCSVTQGTDNVLVYAQAKDVEGHSGDKVYNGSLTPNFPLLNLPLSSTSPEDLGFSLDPMHGDVTVVPAEATALATALTAIANVSVTDNVDPEVTVTWQDLNNTNPIMDNLFQNFINHGQALPGSAESVRQWIQTVHDAALELQTPATRPDGITEEGVIIPNINAILTAIQTEAGKQLGKSAISSSTYPRSENLPDGAAALRWIKEDGADGAFVPQLQTTTIDDINTVSRFVYPPSLWYFVDSPIKTSTNVVEFDDAYKQKTWDNVLSTYFTSNTAVFADTRAVAITNPLQYAVAHLKLNVKAQTLIDETTGKESVKYDALNATKTIPIDQLTLTGILVTGQRKVNHTFQPASNSQVDVRIVYDSQVGDTPQTLTTTDKTYHTLLLQSYEGEDVKIILEFQYNGATKFKCLNGWVYPGTRFYLVGEVNLKDQATSDLNDDVKSRVFTKDYTTEVSMTVASLAKAYNLLPSILSKNLEIGVQTTPNWIAATPSGPIILDEE